jgi:hypothetical protein
LLPTLLLALLLVVIEVPSQPELFATLVDTDSLAVRLRYRVTHCWPG